MHLPVGPSHFSLLPHHEVPTSMTHPSLWGSFLPPHPLCLSPVLHSWSWGNRAVAPWTASSPAPQHPYHLRERPDSNAGSSRNYQPRLTANHRQNSLAINVQGPSPEAVCAEICCLRAGEVQGERKAHCQNTLKQLPKGQLPTCNLIFTSTTQSVLNFYQKWHWD